MAVKFKVWILAATIFVMASASYIIFFYRIKTSKTVVRSTPGQFAATGVRAGINFMQNITSSLFTVTPEKRTGESKPTAKIAKKILIVGVFVNSKTEKQDRYIRDAFRESIWRHSLNQSTRFIVKLFFFAGDAANFTVENSTNGDIIQGNFEENMNSGKTFRWFKAASNLDGEFVIKMDQDTVAKWNQFERVASLQPPVYFGTRVMNWGMSEMKSPVKGSVPPSRTCKNFTEKDCWFYMQGAFYGVSMDVAKRISTCTYAQEKNSGPEDAVSGLLIKHCFPSVNWVSYEPKVIFRHGNEVKRNTGKNSVISNIIHQQ